MENQDPAASLNARQQNASQQPASQAQPYPQGQPMPQGQPYPQAQPMPQGQPYPQAQPAPQAQPTPQGQVAPPAAPKAKPPVLAIVSLVCGIVAMLASPTVAGGIVVGMAAILLALICWPNGGKKLAIAGLVCGSVGILASIVLFVSGFSLVGKLVFIPRTEAVKAASTDVKDAYEPVSKKLPAVIFDSDAIRYEVTKMSYEEGDVLVEVSVENKVPNDYPETYPYEALSAPSNTHWYVNGVECDPTGISLQVDAGKSTKSWFFFSHKDLGKMGVKSVEDIYSIHGEIRVDMMVSFKYVTDFTMAVDL